MDDPRVGDLLASFSGGARKTPRDSPPPVARAKPALGRSPGVNGVSGIDRTRASRKGDGHRSGR
jgi:hypothetical protein